MRITSRTVFLAYNNRIWTLGNINHIIDESLVLAVLLTRLRSESNEPIREQNPTSELRRQQTVLINYNTMHPGEILNKSRFKKKKTVLATATYYCFQKKEKYVDCFYPFFFILQCDSSGVGCTVVVVLGGARYSSALAGLFSSVRTTMLQQQQQLLPNKATTTTSYDMCACW